VANDIISITRLEQDAADLIRQIADERRTVTVTQNGEPRVVVVSVDAWDEIQETLATLELLAHSEAAFAQGSATTSEAFDRARAAIRAPNSG
jgi:prevent-host-death family protein